MLCNRQDYNLYFSNIIQQDGHFEYLIFIEFYKVEDMLNFLEKGDTFSLELKNYEYIFKY